MPTKRSRLSRSPAERAPQWVDDLRAGRAPVRGTDDWRAFCGWYFFHGRVEGLPLWDSAEGRALVNELPPETWT